MRTIPQPNSNKSKSIKRKAWMYPLLILSLFLLLAFLLNVSKPGSVVEGCPQGCATRAERAEGPLRIVSLNMLHGYPDFEDLPLRLDLIAAELLRQDADVVLLQEAPWTRMTGNGTEHLAQQLGYNYLYLRANGNRRLIFFEEGEAILTRFPLKDPVFAVLQPRAGFFENRVVLGATAVTPWGDVDFFVAHLTGRDPQVNHGQVESLKDFVEEHSGGLAVVAGDFNAREDSPQITALAGNWIDAYRVVHPIDEGLTCCIGDLTDRFGESLEKRIDYVFLVMKSGERLEIAHTQRVFDQPFLIGSSWQWASDHIGLLVEIDLTPNSN